MPEFKDIPEGELIAKLNRQHEDSQRIEKRMQRLEGMLESVKGMCEENLKVSRDNEKKIEKMDESMKRVLDLLEGSSDRNKENHQELSNTDSQKPAFIATRDYGAKDYNGTRDNKSIVFNSTDNTLSKKLSKTRSILSIEDRKR